MNSDILIVGGGVAGCSIGYFLTKRNLSVTLLESQSIASGGSGNWSGLVSPYPCFRDSSIASWHEAVFQAALEIKEILSDNLTSFRRCGSVQFGVRDRVDEIINARRDISFGSVVSSQESSEITGIPQVSRSIYYPESFALDPRELCSFYSRGLNVLQGETVDRVTKVGDSWTIHTSKASYSSKVLIVATAFQTRWLNMPWLTLEPVKGQVVSVTERGLDVKPKSAICYDGYVVPLIDGAFTLGAAYEHGAKDGEVKEEYSDQICNKAQKWLGPCVVNRQGIRARASFRASTFDRMPFIGKLPDSVQIGTDWRQVSRIPDEQLPRTDGLFCSLGHGSRGISSSILAAKLLVAQIVGEESSIPKELVQKVDPIRLLLRKIKRAEIEAT